MITSNEIIINASPNIIFALANDTQHWPQFLPHILDVRIIEECADSTLVKIRAMRDSTSVEWTAQQRSFPEMPEIRFRHVSGWGQGMEVIWNFEPIDQGTLVIVEHKSALRLALNAESLAENSTSDFFVHALAIRTLACIKETIEHSSAHALRPSRVLGHR